MFTVTIVFFDTPIPPLNNKLAQGRVELVPNDDGTLSYRLDGADPVPFFSKLGMKSTYIKSQIISKSDSVICAHSGYAYIFVVIMANGNTTAPYTIEHNNTVLHDTSASSGYYMLTPIKVKKGDKISWTIAGVSNVFGIALGIAYPD